MAVDKSSVPARSVDQWATIIRADLDRAAGGAKIMVENSINAGRNLEAAYTQLGKGAYGRMLVKVGINDEAAKRLRRIANNQALTNPDNLAKLPRSMRTLAELARFDAPTLEGFIADGTVYVDMERAEVEGLLKGKSGGKSGSKSKSASPTTWPNRQMPTEPKVEPWAQGGGKPPVERMEAKARREAEAEAKALEAKVSQADASLDKLREEKRALQIKVSALESEIEDLKAPPRVASKSDKLLSCSFCDKKQGEVTTLVTGRRDAAAICNECIDLCVGIIRDHQKKPTKQETESALPSKKRGRSKKNPRAGA